MKSALFSMLGILLGFLAGAFYSVSFDISTWTEGTRFAVVMFMTFAGGIGAIIGSEVV